MSFRILALVTDAFGGGGGIAQYNRDFIAALALDAATARIEVLPRLAPRPAGRLPDKTRQHAPSANQVLYSLRAVALALRVKPDVVFCGHLFMAPLAHLLARLTGARLVIQTHGVEIWPRPKPLQRRAVEAADLVLAVSRDTRARVLGWTALAPDRALVAPNTVAEAYRPATGGEQAAARARLGVGSQRVLLSVSRLDAGQRYKGQDRVIPLLPALVARGHDVLFLVAGAGDDAPRLAALAARHDVSDRVRFLGEVPADRMSGLYRAADLYLMPSAGEGFGIVFLEAMASGVPAIGLSLGGAPDALGRGLGEAVDEAGLLDAVDRALSRPRPDPHALAAEVERRYGRPAFQARIACVLRRLEELPTRSSPRLPIRVPPPAKRGEDRRGEDLAGLAHGPAHPLSSPLPISLRVG